MIEQIYIKNFKKFNKESFKLFKHNVFIGENDSGKSTILQALDIFFNQDKIEKSYVIDITEDVEIGIWYNKKFYKKIYSPTTFKLKSTIGDIEELEAIKYIYIPVLNYDAKAIISQLSIAKALQNTTKDLIEDLKKISQSSVEEVLSGIDEDLIVINKTTTNIMATEQFKYEAALKFNIMSDGVPIEGRGTGYQKNLIYSLLIGNNYSNVILGVDEIENSFSINNCNNFLSELQKKIGQTLITTHSRKVLEIKNEADVIPLYTDNCKCLSELLSVLDKTNEKEYLLVEGKNDLPWYKKIIDILGFSDKYIVLPGGGAENAEHLMKELISFGKKCKVIKDGDKVDNSSIKKECIELYTPLGDLNSILRLNLSIMPSNKKDFFDLTIIKDQRNEDTVKSILSLHASDFLKLNNELVNEVSELLKDDKANS